MTTSPGKQEGRGGLSLRACRGWWGPRPDMATGVQTREDWDLVLSPRAGVFDLRLGDLWRYRDLVMLFVWRDFVAGFRGRAFDASLLLRSPHRGE